MINSQEHLYLLLKSRIECGFIDFQPRGFSKGSSQVVRIRLHLEHGGSVFVGLASAAGEPCSPG